MVQEDYNKGKRGRGPQSGVGVLVEHCTAPGLRLSVIPALWMQTVVVGKQDKVVVACPCGVGCTGAGRLVSPHLAEVPIVGHLPLLVHCQHMVGVVATVGTVLHLA